TGLVFVGAPGGSNPAPQTVNIFNPTSTALTFTSSLSGAAGFTVNPTSGTINPGQSVALRVQATIAALPAGTYLASLTITINGIPRTIDLLLVVATGATPSTAKLFRDAAGCTPKSLLPTFTQ